MASPQSQQLHFILVPFLAQGHAIPMIDMAKLLAQRGVIVTIFATQLNALKHKPNIDRAIKDSALQIQLIPLKFRTQEVGLPDGCETVDDIPSRDLVPNFFAAIDMLQHPFEDSLAKLQPRPSCLISDALFPWTSDVAAKYQIPRILFHGTSCFTLLCFHNLRSTKLHERIKSDFEPFLLPEFPHRIEITKAKLPEIFRNIPSNIAEFRERMREAEDSAYGVVVNSFHELEPKYDESFREARHGKTWCIGPVSLCYKEELDKAERGDKAVIDMNQCLKWLDSKEPNSVIYVCLGSLCRLLAPQLIEIGLALEASEHPFVWVVKGGERYRELENWLDREGFEERTKERGLVIRGWAPQVMILSHRAVGGFLTHCGWNSTLEGLCAGVPMITWPMFADQFLNEKLVVEVLKVGYRGGVEVYVECVGDERMEEESESEGLVKKEEIERVIRKLMGNSEESEEMRRRAEEIGEMGRRAVEDGGSSHLNMALLIQDIKNK